MNGPKMHMKFITKLAINMESRVSVLLLTYRLRFVSTNPSYRYQRQHSQSLATDLFSNYDSDFNEPFNDVVFTFTRNASSVSIKQIAWAVYGSPNIRWFHKNSSEFCRTTKEIQWHSNAFCKRKIRSKVETDNGISAISLYLSVNYRHSDPNQPFHSTHSFHNLMKNMNLFPERWLELWRVCFVVCVVAVLSLITHFNWKEEKKNKS